MNRLVCQMDPRSRGDGRGVQRLVLVVRSLKIERKHQNGEITTSEWYCTQFYEIAGESEGETENENESESEWVGALVLRVHPGPRIFPRQSHTAVKKVFPQAVNCGKQLKRKKEGRSHVLIPNSTQTTHFRCSFTHVIARGG